MSTAYLSLQEIADRLGVSRNSVAKYNLPKPDAYIGTTRGWLPETIDTWDAARPRKKRVPRPDSQE
ncbi:XRE family transcriptional regulator [Jonesiaceae bacterium BS-20]|uniref:XRE family transcriptional regulator n=1 Tax=Jonesiaceae bacterium BS-20 TaxID=3120821 RepID=A0AAU7DWB1_9MICO